jgi:hypothetical protein
VVGLPPITRKGCRSYEFQGVSCCLLVRSKNRSIQTLQISLSHFVEFLRLDPEAVLQPGSSNDEPTLAPRPVPVQLPHRILLLRGHFYLTVSVSDHLVTSSPLEMSS